MKERDVLTKMKSDAEAAKHKAVDLVKINESAQRNLMNEIQGYRAHAQKQNKVRRMSQHGSGSFCLTISVDTYATRVCKRKQTL